MEVIIPSPATGPGVLDLASKCSSPCLSSTAEDYNTSGEFALCSSGRLHTPSISADVLFDGGKIKPLKLLSPSQYHHVVSIFPESPRSPKRMLTRAVLMAPRHEKRDHNDYPLRAKTKQEKEEASFLTIIKLVKEPNLVKHTTLSLSLSSNSSRNWTFTDFLMLRGSSNKGSVTDKDDSAFTVKSLDTDMKARFLDKKMVVMSQGRPEEARLR